MAIKSVEAFAESLQKALPKKLDVTVETLVGTLCLHVAAEHVVGPADLSARSFRRAVQATDRYLRRRFPGTR